jgi:hypothetical protein
MGTARIGHPDDLAYAIHPTSEKLASALSAARQRDVVDEERDPGCRVGHVGREVEL